MDGSWQLIHEDGKDILLIHLGEANVIGDEEQVVEAFVEIKDGMLHVVNPEKQERRHPFKGTSIWKRSETTIRF
jgi:hypothetical protein